MLMNLSRDRSSSINQKMFAKRFANKALSIKIVEFYEEQHSFRPLRINKSYFAQFHRVVDDTRPNWTIFGCHYLQVWWTILLICIKQGKTECNVKNWGFWPIVFCLQEHLLIPRKFLKARSDFTLALCIGLQKSIPNTFVTCTMGQAPRTIQARRLKLNVLSCSTIAIPNGLRISSF